MADMVVDANPLITFVLFNLPGIGEDSTMARPGRVEYLGLGDYAGVAQIIASELVTNAIQHANADWTEKIGVPLMRAYTIQKRSRLSCWTHHRIPQLSAKLRPTASRGEGCTSLKNCPCTGAGPQKTAESRFSQCWRRQIQQPKSDEKATRRKV